jgi:hypothetical protein
MTTAAKKLSNPFSTGGGGGHFEAHVQASFVALMLTGGFAPCLPCWPIMKVKLQGKFAGYDIDDLVVFVANEDGRQERKLLGQIKHSISITENDSVFGEVIQAAWNDFNNAKIFTRNRDAIALITGPLRATDISDVRPILERARHYESSDEFFKNIELGNFTSDGQRRKLKAFQTQLRKANGGQDVPTETAFEFLRHFHLLGYDLDIKAGVTLSLLHSLIGQNAQASAQALWAMLVDEVQSANKNAGTLTKESLSEDVRTAFTKQALQSIPPEYTVTQVPATKSDISDVTYASELSVANLLGSWSERADADRVVVEKLASGNYSAWIRKVRETLQQPNCLLSLKEGKWRVIERLALWQALGPRLFDEDLDVFRQCAVSVLAENHPMFELPSEERHAASIHGKALRHSIYLRKGLAETLAILSAHPEPLTHCSIGKTESTAVLAVREILADVDWLRWASLNDLLPLLAEAAPGEFLDSIEKALNREPCPFDQVFAQEGDGFTGGTYMSGILWALEALAWNADHLSRVVMCLGELAARDPGGRWSNRPANSLTSILLPWMPQTCASIAKRSTAVSTLLAELPDIGWKLLVSLLPQSHSTSSGTRKPAWRKTIPDDWSKGVTLREYWDQVALYSEMAITAAKSDREKLAKLIDYVQNFPPPAHEQLLAHLGSDAVITMPEADRLVLWTELVDMVTKHRKFSDAGWAMKPEQVDKIAALAERLAPDAPAFRHQRLFSERDFDLYEEKGNYEDQRNELEDRRQKAVEEVAANGGAQAVLSFAAAVQSPWRVGISFGAVAGKEVDGVVLPNLLESEQKQLAQLAGGFAWSRFHNCGWQWVDNINISQWSPAQIGEFLSLLPFTLGTWERATRLLGGDESVYWKKTSANPYDAEAGLESAIDQLIQNGRPYAAIRCLRRMMHGNQPFDTRRAVRALLAALQSSENAHSMDAHEIVEIIKALQNDLGTSPDDLFKVEWAYLPLLKSHHDASPKLLGRRLANEPGFFCEVIRLVFRSKNDKRPTEEATEEKKNIATNAYHLLSEWRNPPGCREDGTYDGDALAAWLDAVKKECSDTGHLDIAMTKVGHALIHVPPDENGLWIHHSAAAALNAKDAKDMRNGFRNELFNSRGVHWVDPTGKPERELAGKYRAQAEAVEGAGYHRLATTLRELAESYEREAERVSAGERFND